mmetsp:Transcript_47845/g.55120  ORF Transcript_47845/g.55120 Transcript_47845/m.55120 type:complete len:225 (+) Transcript_47845:1-675(+)
MSKYFTISTISSVDGYPQCHRFVNRGLDSTHKMVQLATNRAGITFCLDNRSLVFQNLLKNPKGELLWHFPFTREQFRLKCNIILLSPKAETTIDDAPSSWQDILNKPTFHFSDLQASLKLWKSLTEEERLSHQSICPDTPAEDIAKYNDLDKYECQELEFSANFAIAICVPLEVEYTSFPLPQAVANSRPAKHESLLQPPKKIRKWLHHYQYDEQSWSLTKLNP